MSETVLCPDCGGTGEAPPEDDVDQCLLCGGEGEVDKELTERDQADEFTGLDDLLDSL